MKKELNKIVDKYADYDKRRAVAKEQLERDIADVHSTFMPDKREAEKQKLRDKHDAIFKREFNNLGDALSEKLLMMETDVKQKIEQLKGDDLKLTNVIKMLETLDGEDLKKNTPAIVEAVKPYTYDPVARAVIEKLALSKMGFVSTGLFDDSDGRLLERIEEARNFTKEESYYSYNDVAISLRWYIDYHFYPDNVDYTPVVVNPFADSGEPVPFSYERVRTDQSAYAKNNAMDTIFGD